MFNYILTALKDLEHKTVKEELIGTEEEWLKVSQCIPKKSQDIY